MRRRRLSASLSLDSDATSSLCRANCGGVLGRRRRQARVLDHGEARRLGLAGDRRDRRRRCRERRSGRADSRDRAPAAWAWAAPGRSRSWSGRDSFMSQTKRLRPGLGAGLARAAAASLSSLERVTILRPAESRKVSDDRLLGVLGQPVIDDRAVRRVLADVEMLAHARAVRPLDHDGAAVDAEGRAVGDAGAHVGAGAPVQLGADRRARREQARSLRCRRPARAAA